MRRRSQNALVFMAKWPQAGSAKTRLTPALTPAHAAQLARCFLLDTLEEAAQAGADRWLAFTPLSREDRFRQLIGPDVGLIPAEAPAFGTALCRAQRAAFRLGYQRVALVASNIPHLPALRYREAFAQLETCDAVLGPCGDGGYYLLATSAPSPHLFHGVAWSTSTVYETTLCRAGEAHLSLRAVAPCDDVDTPADLGPLLAALRERPGAGRSLELLDRLEPSPARAVVLQRSAES